jgi:Tol biopolymer transport system component
MEHENLLFDVSCISNWEPAIRHRCISEMGPPAKGALALGLLFAALAAGCRSDEQAATTTAARPPAAAEWIAFHADPDGADDLYAVKTDGSETRQLTQGLEQIAGAPWSPDGHDLALLARPSGVDDVYIVGADGENLRQLTENDGDHHALSWSPDGLRLLYVCCDETDPGVYVINADGSGRKLLAENAGQPAWSPDGSRIAYISLADPRPDIYTMQADGSDQRRLTSDAEEDVDPAWSPDGGQIAFTSRRTGRSQIYVMDDDGQNQRRLASDRWSDQQPAWSPDGTEILFTSFRNRDPLLRGIGNADIVVASASGTGVRNLTRSPAWEGDPAWSPDGKAIAFSIRKDFGEAGTFRIGVMTAAGTNRRLFRQIRALGDLPANACCPSWQPGAAAQNR